VITRVVWAPKSDLKRELEDSKVSLPPKKLHGNFST